MVARHGEFDFGAGWSKRMAFLWKNALIGHRSISLQSVCAKITSSRMIAVERCSAQKRFSSAIALLQMFDLFFAGSWVATVFVMSHTYCIYWGLLFIRNYLKATTHAGKHSRLATDIDQPILLSFAIWIPHRSGINDSYEQQLMELTATSTEWSYSYHLVSHTGIRYSACTCLLYHN